MEIAVIIGNEGYEISEDRALEFACGYTIALDMSIRDPEDRSWRKSFDTFSVLEPWLVTADEIGDVRTLIFRSQ